MIKKKEHFQDYDDSNSNSNRNRVDDLDDNILLNILERIPWIWAVPCKAVCKRWYFLISNPQYNICSTFTFIYQISFFYQRTQPFYEYALFYSFTENPKSKTLSLGLPLLTSYNCLYYLPSIQIVSSYKNLLVCFDSPPTVDKSVYYIVDPFMRRYIQIPPALTQHSHILLTPAFGFTVMENSCTSSTSSLNYRLVCVLYSSVLHFTMEIFSSETGEWELVVLPTLREKSFDFEGCVNSTAITFNHKLHWVDKNSLMVYDPFDDYYKYTLFDVPSSKVANVTHSLGVYEGRLLLSQLEANYPYYMLNVWKLDDHNHTRVWRLENRTCLNSLVCCGLSTWGLGIQFMQIEVLAFHPYDPMTLLLSFGDQLFRCNLRRGTVREIMTWRDPNVWLKKKSVFSLCHDPSHSVITLPSDT